MNRNPFPNSGRVTEVSGWGCWLVLLAFSLLFGFVGLGWLVNSFLILFGLLLVLPLVFWAILGWWLRRNLVRAPCPVCQTEFAAVKANPCRCPNCGEPLRVREGFFERLTPEGTIDVEAIDVSSPPLPASETPPDGPATS